MLNDTLYFEHQLLRDIGGMTLTEMRGRMPVAEFQEHVAFYRRRSTERPQ